MPFWYTSYFHKPPLKGEDSAHAYSFSSFSIGIAFCIPSLILTNLIKLMPPRQCYITSDAVSEKFIRAKQ